MSDGTSAGTQMVLDINAGIESSPPATFANTFALRGASPENTPAAIDSTLEWFAVENCSSRTMPSAFAKRNSAHIPIEQASGTDIDPRLIDDLLSARTVDQEHTSSDLIPETNSSAESIDGNDGSATLGVDSRLGSSLQQSKIHLIRMRVV
jgi:hypothetical protein